MPSSHELIEELVSLTQNSLRRVETDIAEVRADVRVLSERVKNDQISLERVEADFVDYRQKTDESIKELTDRIQAVEKSHARYLGAAGVIGAVLGFAASIAKGLLGL